MTCATRRLRTRDVPERCALESVAVTVASAAEVSAVYTPSAVIEPADAAHVTSIGTLSPAAVRPDATNGCVWLGSSATLSGATRT